MVKMESILQSKTRIQKIRIKPILQKKRDLKKDELYSFLSTVFNYVGFELLGDRDYKVDKILNFIMHGDKRFHANPTYPIVQGCYFGHITSVYWDNNDIDLNDITYVTNTNVTRKILNEYDEYSMNSCEKPYFIIDLENGDEIHFFNNPRECLDFIFNNEFIIEEASIPILVEYINDLDMFDWNA